MEQLADRSCAVGGGGQPALQGAALDKILAELGHGWTVSDDRLVKTFSFSDFAAALAFVNVAGAIAEAENHHPDIALSWGKAGFSIWTHTVNGLTDADFILAAKIERAFQDK